MRWPERRDTEWNPSLTHTMTEHVDRSAQVDFSSDPACDHIQCGSTLADNLRKLVERTGLSRLDEIKEVRRMQR